MDSPLQLFLLKQVTDLPSIINKSLKQNIVQNRFVLKRTSRLCILIFHLYGPTSTVSGNFQGVYG